jgi:hypothetical protein
MEFRGTPIRTLAPVAFLVLFVAELPALRSEERVAKGRYPPRMEGAAVEVYKTVGDVPLTISLFRPRITQPKISGRRSCSFRRGWNSSRRNNSKSSASTSRRDLVAMTADYRVASRHQVKATACVTDAKSAVRWVRRMRSGSASIPTESLPAVDRREGICACAGTSTGSTNRGGSAISRAVARPLQSGRRPGAD